MAAGVSWLVRRLRTESDARRWDWAGSAIETWDATGLGFGWLQEVVDEALARARAGRFDVRELKVVARRRLRRHAAQTMELADRYAQLTRPD